MPLPPRAQLLPLHVCVCAAAEGGFFFSATGMKVFLLCFGGRFFEDGVRECQSRNIGIWKYSHDIGKVDVAN